MSGIYGINYNPSVFSDIAVHSMAKWNQVYGKNDRGQYDDDGLSMGCFTEKLSESAVHSAPVIIQNNKIAVLDVVLYNRQELMQLCHITNPCSDEELLFSYIERFGADALKNVNGDFAGAICDTKNNTLLLFRDHMGVRPLFFQHKKDFVAFSTDIRGITALPQADISINEDWIYKTIAGYSAMSTESTEFASIFCVEPAEYVTFTFQPNEGIRKQKKKYWKLGSKKILFSTNDEYQKQLRELITDSVHRRLDAVSGTVGAELSGGMDSGVIDILINRARRKGIFFSWSLDPKVLPMAENDERLIIEDICRQEHITCNFSGSVPFLDETSNIAESFRQMGVPLSFEQLPALRYALPPYINALTICETAQFINRSGSHVVFTGHGGDEGVSHRCNPYELFYHKEYAAYFRHFWNLAKGQPRRPIRTAKYIWNNLTVSRQRFHSSFCMVDGVPDFLAKEFAAKYSKKDMPRVTFAYDPKSHINAGATCNRLANTALLGAYCGVRYLAPFMDYRVIDFAVSIPRSQYLQNNVKRFIFREAFKDIMPDSLYQLTAKEDNSKKNRKPDPDWYTSFVEKKQQIVTYLNRDFWKNYLNYEKIDAWSECGEPTLENMEQEQHILNRLFYCAMIQNLVEKSRS